MKIIAALLALCGSLLAQSGVPRLPNGRPDLNGVWERPYVPDMSRSAGANQKGPGTIPFTPEYAQIFRNYDPAKFDYTGHCLPQGLTRSMNSPFPIRIVETSDLVTILYEAWNVFEIIHTDGRPHPKDPDPTFNGNSVAHWEGDTLVIDTIALDTRANFGGFFHSEQEHVIERFSRPSKNYLVQEDTVEDPVVLAKPWKSAPRTWSLAQDPHDEWGEVFCTHNEEPEEIKGINAAKEKANGK